MQLKKPIFGHFLPKFPSIRFFPEKSFEFISNLDASVTSRKMHWFCVYFGPLYNTSTLYKKFDPFWPFLTQLLKTRFSLKQSFKCICRFYVAVISCKNQKNSTSWFFIKLEKPHFESILGSFGPTNPEQSVFQKNQSLTFLKLNNTLISCKKKSQKIYASGFHLFWLEFLTHFEQMFHFYIPWGSIEVVQNGLSIKVDKMRY